MADTSLNRQRFPEMFEFEKGQIDRRTCRRVVPMEVLALGLPRTGTASLREALKILGYDDVHHMNSIFANPQEAVMWREAAEAKWFGKGKPFGREEFDMMLGHCMATCDWPTSAFHAELITAYPSAKIILNTRPFVPWYKSMSETVMVTAEGSSSFGNFSPIKIIWNLLGYFDTEVCAKTVPFMDAFYAGNLGGKSFTEVGRKMYDEHYEAVRREVSADRLLEFEVKEGWEPLCRFLGKEVPEVEFPRVNDSKDFGDRIGVFVGLATKRVMWKLVPVVGVVVVVGAAAYASYRGVSVDSIRDALAGLQKRVW